MIFQFEFVFEHSLADETMKSFHRHAEESFCSSLTQVAFGCNIGVELILDLLCVLYVIAERSTGSQSSKYSQHADGARRISVLYVAIKLICGHVVMSW